MTSITSVSSPLLQIKTTTCPDTLAELRAKTIARLYLGLPLLEQRAVTVADVEAAFDRCIRNDCAYWDFRAFPFSAAKVACVRCSACPQ
jgi:hypothetical protein